MRSWRKASRATAAAVALALALTACGGDGDTPGTSGSGGEEGEPQSGGTVTYAMNAEVASLDAALCGNSLDRCAPIYGTLLRYNLESEEFEGYMAESFESEDGQNWTLTLREGITFSDDTPFDAEAVAFNWDRIADPATLSPGARVVEDLTWEIVDETTLEVTSAEPNFQLPWAMVLDIGMIASPTAIEEAGEDFGSEPVGAGPFVVDNWVRSSEQQMSRNESYWEEGLPYLDNYVIKIIGPDDQRLNALRTGEIDIDWSLLTKDAATAESEGFTVNRIPLIGGTGLQFNLNDPVAGDEDLRQALLHAFDSKQINDAVYGGDPPVDAFLFPDSPYRGDELGVFPALDLEAAQESFDTYLEKTGQTSETVTFHSYAGIPALEQVAQIIQAQMQEIDGLTFEINAVDATTIVSDTRSGNFQLAMGATLSPHMDKLFEVFHSEGALNVMGYSNPAVDEALETSRTSDDPDEVTEAYQVLNGALSTDGPLRNWRYQFGHLYTTEEVHGLQLMGTNSGLGSYMQGVWIDQ